MTAPSLYPVPRIAACFGDLIDPRTGPATRHRLLDVLTIALCATICGEDTWVGIEEWATIREAELTAWLGLPHGIPSHDTFGRVFARIDPVQFETGFWRWTQAALPLPPGQTIAIDGKTARRSGDARTGQSPLHLVSAYACAQHLVLGQEAVADHSNELTAIPMLLERLVLTDQVVTIDAIGCQKDLAAQIIDQGGDYVLALKENQPTLLDDVIDGFAMADRTADPTLIMATTIEKDHGRREHRLCAVLADPAFLAWLDPDGGWPGLHSVIRITATRIRGEAAPDTGTTATRYYVSSLPPDAVRLNQVIRSHWAVENGLHWVLDMVCREDASRVRRGYGQQNLAVLRKLTLNLVRHSPDRGNRSLAIQRKRAGWSMDVLYSILGLT